MTIWHKFIHRMGWQRGEVVSWTTAEKQIMIGFQCSSCGKITGRLDATGIVDQDVEQAMNIYDNGFNAKVFTTEAEFIASVNASGQMAYGWIENRLIQLYPGGRNIDWTRFYARETAKISAAGATHDH